MRGLWGAAILAVLLPWLSQAAAEEARPEPAYLVIDAANGAVLAERNATQLSYPASVTKAMTAYMVFMAMAEGRLAPEQSVTVSAKAAAQPPTKLGLRAGGKATVKLLLEALIVRSANDAAVALAEAVSGSEAAFATAMTRQARALGMHQTVFANASGLPDPAQVTTARDLAILGRALAMDFPDRFALFSRRHVAFGEGSQPTLNGWLGSYPGAEGIKTGFTCGSGYNLLAAATRDGRRLIGVVLGAATGGGRNALMRKIMDAGFATPREASGALLVSALRGGLKSNVNYVLGDGRCAVAPTAGTEIMAREELPGWGLVFGSFVSKAEAKARIDDNLAALGDVVRKAQPTILARTSLATHPYSALLVGLEQDDAGAACRHLQAMGVYCLAVPPKLLNNPQAMWR